MPEKTAHHRRRRDDNEPDVDVEVKVTPLPSNQVTNSTLSHVSNHTTDQNDQFCAEGIDGCVEARVLQEF